MLIAKKLTEKIILELELFKWMANLSWFVFYEWSLSFKFKGDHKGVYWSWWILGLKLIEFNIYSTAHDSNTFEKGNNV